MQMIREEASFDTSVVIPVYFNEESIERVVVNLRCAWEESGRPLADLDIVLVDDSSGDNSWEKLVKLREDFPDQVTALRLTHNHGSQLAILAGSSLARGRRITMIAADGQEPSDLVPRMVDANDTGSRVVLAVRKSRDDTLRTRTGASFFYHLIRFLGLKNMPRSGFDAFLVDRDVLEMMLEMRDPNLPLSVTIAWLGFPYAEVAYERLARNQGRSRWTLRKKMKLAIDAITSVSYVPLRAISLLGIVVALLGFLYAIIVIIYRLLGHEEHRGWASILVVTLALGGTQLLALGVLGEYLWRTLEVSRRRPLWRIAEVKHPKHRKEQQILESIADE